MHRRSSVNPFGAERAQRLSAGRNPTAARLIYARINSHTGAKTLPLLRRESKRETLRPVRLPGLSTENNGGFPILAGKGAFRKISDFEMKDFC